jgi:osmotically-inducible protein OsmY
MGTAKDIRVAVEAELRFDPMVDAAGITVNDIGGNVALNGTVPSYPQYLEAAAANTTLAGNSTLPNTVQATARGGNLTLAGAVRNGAQRAAAEQAVTGLTGIRNVRDQIEVIFGDPFSDVTVLVQDAIDRYAVLFDNSKVTVSTSGHAVTLAGHVRTWAEHDAAVAAAWMAHGISNVHDQIQVTS